MLFSKTDRRGGREGGKDEERKETGLHITEHTSNTERYSSKYREDYVLPFNKYNAV